MASEAIHLHYEGPPALVSALAQGLEEAGVAADYNPPVEYKSLAAAAAVTSLVLTATGPLVDVRAAVSRFLSRHPGTAVTGVPEDKTASLQARLSTVEQLFADGDISQEERAAQRRRIMDSL